MSKSLVPIRKEAALAALEADTRTTPFHSFAGSVIILGADTSRESIIAAIESSDESEFDEHPQIGWIDDPQRPGHQLIVIDGQNVARWYDVKAPDGTFGEPT